jgi:hypothetical protein
MAARNQLEVGRLRCGRSVDAEEDVSGTDGLPIGQARVLVGVRARLIPQALVE